MHSTFQKLFDPSSTDGELKSILSTLEPARIESESFDHLVQAAFSSSNIPDSLRRDLVQVGADAIDCAGTGGSGLAHFNTSSSAAFVLAAAKIPVAKFGGRAASSKSGSFDFLDHLGLNSHLSPSQIPDAIEKCGLAFILAANCYPQLKRLAPLRKELGKPTVLNYIGPLLNPVRPGFRVMGVSCQIIHPVVANHLLNRKELQKAVVVTSINNLDEFSESEISKYSLIEKGQILESSFDPKELNFRSSRRDQTLELDSRNNVKIFERIISSDDKNSEFYHLLLINSASGLLVAGRVKNLAEGVAMAADIISSGAVAEQLELCRRYHGKFSE